MKEPVRGQLADFPITRRWPPRNPKAIQLYSLPTPNGVKVSIALEELGCPMTRTWSTSARTTRCQPGVPVAEPQQQDPRDHRPEGPGGQPLALFESGAILIYLAEKTGRLIRRRASATKSCSG